MIKERVAKKVGGWLARAIFSAGGKEVLTKSIAQAIPTYTIGLFKLLKRVVHDLNRALANFWWGRSNKGRKIHWRRWGILCKPKWSGGLGLRDFEIFNQAMLAKQAWHILQNPQSLVAKVLKAKYFHSSDFLESKLGHRPSFVWRSISRGKELLMKGLVQKVGDGSSIKVYHDN